MSNIKNKTIFLQNIEKNQELYDIYQKALLENKIISFDQTIINRLRHLYYGLFSGLIYIYYPPSDNNHLGNKVELLTHTLDDREYNVVQGKTNSTSKYLDSNCWIEVEEGHEIWVYDLFSLLKVEKDIYYKLENPQITKKIPKTIIINHPSRQEDDYTKFHDGFDIILTDIIPTMEDIAKTHPYSDLLVPEITRYKGVIRYDDIKLKYLREFRR